MEVPGACHVAQGDVLIALKGGEVGEVGDAGQADDRDVDELADRVAQLYGTVALLEPEERALIKGTIVNKFRGDRAILMTMMSYSASRLR